MLSRSIRTAAVVSCGRTLIRASRRVSIATAARVLTTSRIVPAFAFAIAFSLRTWLTRSFHPCDSTITSTRFGVGDS
jgi:hypothetical protein